MRDSFDMFGKRFSRALAVTTVASLVMATAAFADNLDDTLAAGSVANPTIAEGGSFTVTIDYQVQQTGSNNTTFPATVNFALSGAPVWASVSPASRSFTGYSNVQSVTVSGTAPAGSGGSTYSFSVVPSTSAARLNTSPAETSLSVTVTAPTPPSDTTAPVITPNVDGTLGTNGWYTSDVTVSWSVVDNESAISSSTGCTTTTISSDTTGTTLTCSATSAGGTSSESVTIKRDATAPSVSLVGGPADGASYYFGSVPAAPTCSASDATSGLTGPCAVSGYDSAVGTHIVTASATDNAGNSNSVSASYTVLAWTVSGFYRPVDMGVLNSAKAGSTIPLKFEVFAGTTELTDIAIVKTFTQKIACDNTGTADAIEEYATGNTSLRYDTTGGQFIFNWKTPSTKGCYRVSLETQDGTKITADFQLK